MNKQKEIELMKAEGLRPLPLIDDGKNYTEWLTSEVIGKGEWALSDDELKKIGAKAEHYGRYMLDETKRLTNDLSVWLWFDAFVYKFTEFHGDWFSTRPGSYDYFYNCYINNDKEDAFRLAALSVTDMVIFLRDDTAKIKNKVTIYKLFYSLLTAEMVAKMTAERHTPAVKY